MEYWYWFLYWKMLQGGEFAVEVKLSKGDPVLMQNLKMEWSFLFGQPAVIKLQP